MIKISYPDDFHKDYISCLGLSDKNEEYKEILLEANISEEFFDKYPLERILTEKFDNLVKISDDLVKISENYDKEKVKDFFSYGGKQPKIRDFFEKYIEINTCYFCNIDFINPFFDFGNYYNVDDLIREISESQNNEGNNAEKDLGKIKDVGDKTKEKIIKIIKDNNIKKISDLKEKYTSKKTLENIEGLKIKTKHKYNHFTLDHVLAKGTHPLFALSLYNFVPCCSPCNSKFKISDTLVKDSKTAFLSPSSDNFNFTEDVSFKIYFKGENIPSEAIEKYTDENYYVDLEVNNKDRKSDYENYIKIFKLRGRYNFHNKELNKLVNKKKCYPECKIEEMEKLLKTPSLTIKKHIFGEELFNAKSEAPMIKFKKDLAKNIGII